MPIVTVNDAFPHLETNTLKKKKLIFPDMLKGRRAMLSVVFEDNGQYMNQQNQSTAWQLIWEKELKPKGVEFYEIPMMRSKYKWISFIINGSMRSGIDPSFHDNVACYYGDVKDYIRILDAKNLSEAHIYLIDEKGIITASTKGLPDAEKIKSILK